MKILKTPLTNPMILILGAIAAVENIGQVLDHELTRAKNTMIMIPTGALWVTAIITM
jgi:hypothetical protein